MAQGYSSEVWTLGPDADLCTTRVWKHVARGINQWADRIGVTQAEIAATAILDFTARDTDFDPQQFAPNRAAMARFNLKPDQRQFVPAPRIVPGRVGVAETDYSLVSVDSRGKETAYKLPAGKGATDITITALGEFIRSSLDFRSRLHNAADKTEIPAEYLASAALTRAVALKTALSLDNLDGVGVAFGREGNHWMAYITDGVSGSLKDDKLWLSDEYRGWQTKTI